MKAIYKYIALAFAGMMACGSLTSCEDYLDKDPDSDITEDQPFKNFTNMQGYVEEIYNCIPNKVQSSWTSVWNLGDDEILNDAAQANQHLTYSFDQGDFFSWQGHTFWYFGRTDGIEPTSGSAFNHATYAHAWYCIAKCNKALTPDENGLTRIDKYFVGSQEEKNLILGQLYFFRAWWHFEMMQYLGGLPYIDAELPTGEKLTLPRLSYRECADKAAEDFRRAADLLPINWDDTKPGRVTSGNNELRITKIAALGYLGKNYLWAASPLMVHGAQKGGKMTYSYDNEYAQKAADALGEALALIESGQTQYKFATFDYENVYDHEAAAGVDVSFSELFYTHGKSGIQPGGKEAILRGPSVGWSFTRYNHSRLFGPNDLCAQDNVIHLPTANYVAYYGMANGLPLDDPESGFDPEHPFKDRDPRFYHDIVFDGVPYANQDQVGQYPQMKYAGLATGGSMRAPFNASRTGYFYQKLVPHQCHGNGTGYDDGGAAPHAYLPYMRLADLYLMYAEATAAFGGPTGKSSKCSLTSVDAINKVRDRVGLGHVAAKFTGNAYMDEVRRERAVELAFEGFRFNDLQRWLLLTEPKYTVKTSQEFTRVESEDFFAENDPAEARVANFHTEVILQRNYDTKHYWLPFYRDDTYLYEGFEQNPGW